MLRWGLALTVVVVATNINRPVAFAEGEVPSARNLRAREVLAEVRRVGGIAGLAVVDDDVDLSLLRAPTTFGPQPIVFSDVRFRGRLSGTPRHPLRFEGGSVCVVEADASGSGWPHSVEFRSATLVYLRFRGARLDGAFSCVHCKVCQAGFEDAQFAGEATFTGTRFSEPGSGEACVRSAPKMCRPADFSEATFASTARFDRTKFREGASFSGAEFRGSARFPSVVAHGPLWFIGVRMRSDAEFRDCTLTGVYFGDARAATYEATEFASRADFRGCKVAGPVRFDDAVFMGDARLARARISSDLLSFRGVLASQPLDVRGMSFAEPHARILLDATAADALRLDWDALGAAVLRGVAELPGEERVPVLEALARRLQADGAVRSAREVAFQVEHQRRSASGCEAVTWGACIAEHLEWWVWTRPTRNGSDPTLILAVLASLWASSAAAALRRGQAVVLPRMDKDDRTATYGWACVDQCAAGSYCPIGSWRVREALKLATGLVLKLGSPRARFATPASYTWAAAAGVGLRCIWALGWLLLGALAGVVAATFPGLEFLKAAV